VTWLVAFVAAIAALLTNLDKITNYFRSHVFHSQIESIPAEISKLSLTDTRLSPSDRKADAPINVSLDFRSEEGRVLTVFYLEFEIKGPGKILYWIYPEKGVTISADRRSAKVASRSEEISHTMVIVACQNRRS
jgi:hypothetical protein